MPPLQGTPQSIPPEEGASSSEVPPNPYQKDDAETSSFLENLDMSDFQDFNFSSLMDLDHPKGGCPVESRDVTMTNVFNAADQTVPTAEQVSSNFNNVCLSATVDPSLLQLSEEDWLRQIPELNNIAPLPLQPANTFEASFLSPALLPQSHQGQWEAPQGLDNCPHDHQIQVPGEISGITHPWDPSQLSSSNPIMISGNTTVPSMLDERQRTYEHANSGGIASNPTRMNPIPSASGPIIRYQGPLPPARRGGRRRRLTVEQAQRQQMARSNGVCIRCRLTGRSCEGGFPCKACLALRKPRLWRGPCTKAQFLEIIECGSFFLNISKYHLLPAHLGVHEAMSILACYRHLLDQGQETFFYLSGGLLVVEGSFRFAHDALRLLCFPHGKYESPSTHQILDVERQLKHHVPVKVTKFSSKPLGFDAFRWVVGCALFCGMTYPAGSNDENISQPFFFEELSLFRFLQNAASCPSDIVLDQEEFIYSALFILVLSISRETDSGPIAETRTCSNLTGVEFAELMDRQHRVRTALWIYASVFIAKLPAWTNFWEHLPIQLQALRRSTSMDLKSSLKDFDLGFSECLDAYFTEKRAFSRHAATALDGKLRSDHKPICSQDCFKCLSWKRSRLETARRKARIEHHVLCGFNTLKNKIEEYINSESEKILAPKGKDEYDAAVYSLFGILLSMANLPPVQKHSPFSHLKGGISPSFVSFKFFLCELKHRVPGIYRNQKLEAAMGPAGCVEHSSRWLKVANIFGDAAFLMGAETGITFSVINLCNTIGAGSNTEFIELKRRLLSNSSWLKARCSKLNGLLQALLQISDPENEVARVRAFQRLLRRKVWDAFGDSILDAYNPSWKGIYMALVLKTLFSSYFPSRSEALVMDKHKQSVWSLFNFSIAKISEEVFEGRRTANEESAPFPQQFGQILQKMQCDFIFRYHCHLLLDPGDDYDAKCDIMRQRISRIMTSCNNWFQHLYYERGDDDPIEAEVWKAFGDLFED